MMKKVITLSFFLFFFLFSKQVLAEEKTIDIYLFYGEGCPHCEKEQEYLNKYDQDSNIKIHKYEVWKNEQNSEILSSVAEKMNVEARGVPYTVIGSKVIVGFDGTGKEIESAIEYCRNNNYTDAIAELVTNANEEKQYINETNTIGNGEYAITKYDIVFKVNENNSFDITENLTTNFNVEKHGIFRKLPLKNTVKRLDGTTSTNHARIKNISVSDRFTVYNEGNYRVIKIGDPDFTLTGEKKYIITYNYNIGRDPLKDTDELYLNLIGNEFDTTISNLTFTIKMPKAFDESKLGFSSGLEGSTDSSKITYQVDNNTITGKYNGVLNAGEGLNVRLELPEGYFIATSNLDLITILSIILPILFALIGFYFWNKYGKDDQVIETVEFYPPEGFNSAEVGFLYKGKAGTEEVVSLLIYLANKGYIKISEIEEKSLFTTKKGFKITKLREYDGNNINEKVFLNGLFSKKPAYMSLLFLTKKIKDINEVEDTTNGVTEVTSTDLYDNFYVTLGRITADLNQKENKNKIFEGKTSGKSILIVLMTIITFILITVKPVYEYSDITMLPVALLCPGIGFSVMFGMIFGNTNMSVKMFGLIWGAGFGGLPWIFLVLPILLQEPIYLVIYIIGLICILFMVIFISIMPKRTQYGNAMLGKIRGFKNFLETAEKPKLEEMVMHDPSYFYNILPFTYVLGVSDKWIKKFETISLQAPDWYDGNTTFNVLTFNTFIDSTLSSASDAMSSSPSSDGGGGSSGGGSSGGGSGGGGGGSW